MQTRVFLKYFVRACGNRKYYRLSFAQYVETGDELEVLSSARMFLMKCYWMLQMSTSELLTLMMLGFLKVVFSGRGGGRSIRPAFILQEEHI